MSLFALRHTPEGRRELTDLLAAKYVRRGACWLNRRAPKGWYRNCLNGGRSRIHTNYGNEGILAISFEYCPEFADSSGYINEGKVLRHFGLWPFRPKACRLGFDTPIGGFRPFEKRYPDLVIGSSALDRAWAELLKDPPAEWRIPYRHPTAFDTRFAQSDSEEARIPEVLPGWRDFFGRLLPASLRHLE